MSQTQAQQYDAIPFPTLPVARSQPEFLATVAYLRGMQPKPAAQARVLELGCASGQNLLPLAERYPDASFVGIDVSGRQIDAAMGVASELELGNVELRHQDILAVDASIGTFDYIIAHGVYSWVEEPVRKKLLSICRDHLAPQGVAYVSYKTHPGWFIHDMIRHMMFYDSRTSTTREDRLARSRLFLDFLSKCCTSDSPYHQLVREQVEPLAQQTDAYLWHDHLAPVSHPVRFEQFMAEAAASNLQPLGDAVFGIRQHNYLSVDSERQLSALTDDSVQQDQLRDMLHNRAGRQTLLCHAATPLNERPPADRLSGLYLAGNLRVEEMNSDPLSTETVHFVTPQGARIGTSVPLVKVALSQLSERWPASINTEDLIRSAAMHVAESGAPVPPDALARLKDTLLQCCQGEAVQVHCDPDQFVANAGDRPLVSKLARWHALRSEIIANRRHEPVRLDSFERNLISHLDGQHTVDQLIDRLAQATTQQEVVVTDQQGRRLSGDEARQLLAAEIPKALTRFANLAFLIA